MHELPITEQIIKIAEKHGKEAGASKIETIVLVVGERSGYVCESIRMYFPLVAKGTLCEEAELVFQTVKQKLRCLSCGALFERRPFSFTCTECGSEGELTEIGSEFYIDSIVAT